jgi:hypothetical protein
MIIKEQSCDITLTILPSEQATAHLGNRLSLVSIVISIVISIISNIVISIVIDYPSFL